MTPGEGQGRHPSVTLFCGQCGRPVDSSRAYCASCGAPVTPAGGTTIGQLAAPPPPILPSTAPAAPPPMTAYPGSTLEAAPPPPSGTPWPASQGTTWQAGMSGLAYTPAAPSAAPRRSARHVVLATVSAVLLVVTVSTAGFWLYNAFAAHQDLTAARYVPRDTFVFVGVDTVQAAANNHQVTESDLTGASGQSDNLRHQTGLDWQSDIMPWLARNLAFAVYLRPAPAGAIGPNAGIGYSYLLQSRDDGKAQAAMQKAAAFQTEQGHLVTRSSYGGFTLHSVANQSGIDAPLGSPASAASTTFTAGKGWALIASDPAAAKVVIDRINGASGSLNDNSAFTSVTHGLPSDRFGTLYIDLQGIERTLAGPTAGVIQSPLLNSYPTAGGYLEWTAAGLRAQMALKGPRPAGVGDLSGDTTGLAGLVPASAVAYAGSANLGASFSASQRLVATATAGGASTTDPFEQLTGQPASSAVFQQPGAVAVLRASSTARDSTPGAVFLLRAPNAAAATDLLQSAAAKQGWTLKPVSVAGVAATEIDSTADTPWYQPQSQPPAIHLAHRLRAQAASSPVGYAAQVHGTLVMAGTQADLAAIVNTANGAASLGSTTRFHQLAQAAPSGAATTVYLDVKALRPNTAAAAGSATADATARISAALLTQVWSASEFSITADLALQG